MFPAGVLTDDTCAVYAKTAGTGTDHLCLHMVGVIRTESGQESGPWETWILCKA